MDKIVKFSGEYDWLSNFSPVYDFLTVEHVYQSAKTTDSHVRNEILNAATPTIAKRLGKRCKLREDWDRIKIPVMRDALVWKFSLGSELAWLLFNTGDAILEEGNWWGDTFWGVCDGEGENNLGRLLMQRRDFIRQIYGG